MDRETLFTGSKWDILKLLERESMSPLELAQETQTSMANISQQLRFLEMAGLVTSERISNRDKGKPRILYSLSGNQSFLISVAPGFVNKGMQELNERKKAILKIWFYEQPDKQYPIEVAFRNVEREIGSIDVMGINHSSDNSINVTIATQDQSLKKKFSDMKVKSNSGVEYTIKYTMVEKIARKDGFYPIYDPKSSMGKTIKRRS